MKTLNLKKVTSVFAASVLTVSIASAAFANPTTDNTAEQGSVAEHVKKMHGDRKGMKNRQGNQHANLLAGKSLEQVKIILELSDDQVSQITTIMDNAKGEKQLARETLKAQLAAGEISKDNIKAMRDAKKEEMKAEREAVKAQIESGEITKEEAKALRETKKAEMQTKRDDIKAEIEAVLTPEQIEKLEALKALNMKNKSKKGGKGERRGNHH